MSVIFFSLLGLFFKTQLCTGKVTARVVVAENLFVVVSVLAHHGCSDLAESDSVSPSRTVQHEMAFYLIYDEGGGEEM